MLTYKYSARDAASGQKVTDTVEAESEQAAAKLIKAQGLTPVSITLAGKDSGFGKFFKKVKAKDRILFARQLSTLINAGLPLVQSLRTVGKQAQSKQLKVIVNQIVADVEAGQAFNVALAKHPETFNQIFISLIAAGETSGTLDAALERIANQQEKDAEILSKVRGAMVYPIVVVFVMIGVLGFMIVKVLPQVKVLYDGLGGNNQLPIVTRILLAISDFTIKYWWAVIIVIALGAFFTSRWARTGPGKEVVDKFKMRAWPAGPLFMKLYMARFARTAQTLIASGVPLLQVMDITANSINNVHIEKSIRNAAEKVKGGKALSESISNDPNFLQLVPDMLRIGEQSGSMEAMTAKVADYYEKEVDQQIKTISTIIEPVLMVVLGVVAFIIVAAVLLPIYGLAGKSGFGG
jgi:type IV pilus assembly protein PilC